MNLKTNERYNISRDYTYWDEFIDYIYKEKTPEVEYWYEINVGSALKSFDVDYFCTYDKNGNFIIENMTEKIGGTQIISKSVLPHILKERLTKFYYEIPEGIIEIHAATIHPYSDPEKTKTGAQGYFIVGKLLDSLYFNSLENISSSKIDLINPDFINKPSEMYINTVISLKNENKKIIKKISFKRPFTLNFNTSKNLLYIIISFFLLSFFIKIRFYKKLIYEPLQLTTKILEENNKNDIKKLKSRKGEFGYIGKLFSENDEQKKNLKKALIKAKESDKLKSAFLTNLSHEIRTPMNAIIGFTDLLANDNIDNIKKNEFIKIVKKSGHSLLSIINDLVEMSQIDTNQATPNYSSFDLDEFLLDIKNTVEITIPTNKPLTIEINSPDKTINAYFNSDEIKLKQILINLLVNAIKFTNDGIIELCYEISADESNIIFQVKDKGIGIDKDKQKNIFNRFNRIQSDKTINLTGLGLGLAISKAYVEMLAGQIWVESKKGLGTTFSFTLPLKLDHSIKNNSTIISSENIIDSSKNTPILIAEDDDNNFILIDFILNELNYKIIRAKDGLEAVEICKMNKSLEFVLMDIKMPKLNGIEAQKQIKKFNPSLPIIAYTAYCSNKFLKEMSNEGFIHCLTKPLDKKKLFNIIKKIQNT